MDSDRLRRRMIAVVAAYAVALQALLLAFLPMAPAALTGPFAVLCAHDVADGTGQPASHDLPCAALCAALGHSISGPIPPGVIVATLEFRLFMAVAPVSVWAPALVARTDPHAPRGPPLA
jgi:hypothetical protein